MLVKDINIDWETNDVKIQLMSKQTHKDVMNIQLSMTESHNLLELLRRALSYKKQLENEK